MSLEQHTYNSSFNFQNETKYRKKSKDALSLQHKNYNNNIRTKNSKLLLPSKNFLLNADGISNKENLQSSMSLSTEQTIDSRSKANKNTHLYKAFKNNLDYSEYSSRKNTKNGIKKNDNKKKDFGQLTEIEEVCDDFSQFWTQFKLASISFWKTLYWFIKIGIIWILQQIWALIAQIYTTLLQIQRGIGIIIMVPVAKLAAKRNSKHPFSNMFNMNKQHYIDSILKPKTLTVVLDLEGTLIHSSYIKPPKSTKYSTIKVKPIGLKAQYIYVQKRPFQNEFLEQLCNEANIVIYSSATQEIVDPILDSIDKHRIINTRLYSNNCYPENGMQKKDLHQVDSCLNKTQIIDDEPHKIKQKDHIVTIKSWRGKSDDNELSKLASNLRQLIEDNKTSDKPDSLDIKKLVSELNTLRANSCSNITESKSQTSTNSKNKNSDFETKSLENCDEKKN